jgi:hypothetical protein
VTKDWYSLEDHVPVLVFEIFMQDSGHHTKRIAHTFAQALSSIGGISRMLILAIGLTSVLLTSNIIQAQKLENLSYRMKDIAKAREFT